MHCDYGEILTELPNGFVPREQWPEYRLIATPPPLFRPLQIGKDPVGMRWGIGFLQFEEYIHDREPDLVLSNADGSTRNRLVMWRRITRLDRPKGWYALSKKPSRLEGFAEIRTDEYWRAWSESARRYRKRWLADHQNKTYRLEKLPFAEFEQAYVQGTVIKKAGREMLNIAKRRTEHEGSGPQYTECWGARRMSDGMLMAGMVITNSPSCHGSYYLCGFYKEESGDDPLMMGLMDNWFRISQERSIRFLHFGGFWKRGDPKSWKGFSIFKAKFGLQYIAYPPVLVRIARGKLL